jgi:hypothetical protein
VAVAPLIRFQAVLADLVAVETVLPMEQPERVELISAVAAAEYGIQLEQVAQVDQESSFLDIPARFQTCQVSLAA